MKIFSNIFSSKNKRKSAQKYKVGMEKTRKGVLNNLNEVLNSSRVIDEYLFDELEEIFIMADIGVNTVVKFIDDLKDNVKLKGIKSPVELRELIVDKMFDIYLKGQIVNSNISFNKDGLTIILFIGVNGVGKTTTIGKVAHKLISDNKSVMFAAGDTFRAGAINQLKVWGERAGCEVISKSEGSDASSVIFDAIKTAKEKDIDVLLCDTAGRLQNKVNLMKELEKINRVIGREVENAPHETLLVIDATTGQNGLSQAAVFNESTDVSGVVLTKLDGTAKGGIVLAIREELDIPIKFVGLGEKIDDLEQFDIEDYIYGLFADVFE